MPVYECMTTTGTLSAEQRQRFALAATRIHAEETGSRAQFVHVLVPEMPVGHSYTAGEIASPAIIRAHIRAGRSSRNREKILRRLEATYRELTSADPMEVMVIVREVPPECALSGGLIMPEPNASDEAAFYAEIDRSNSATPTV